MQQQQQQPLGSSNPYVVYFALASAAPEGNTIQPERGNTLDGIFGIFPSAEKDAKRPSASHRAEGGNIINSIISVRIIIIIEARGHEGTRPGLIPKKVCRPELGDFG